MKIVAPKRQAVRAIPISAAIQAWYYDQLRCLLESMASSMQLHIAAAWKANTPGFGLAQDASSPVKLKRTMSKWGSQWISKFDAMSTEIARKFADKSQRHVANSNAAIFRAAGFTVKFQPTKAAKEAYKATIAQNVGLIRNLPQAYYNGIRNDVWESVMKGSDLDALNKSLRKRYRMTLRRAALISRDQNAKARSLMENIQHRELGITQALWQHSHAVREPRPSHLAFDGKIYDLKKGAFLDGVWTWPGVEINCRCSSRPIIPGFNDQEIAQAKRRAVSSAA
jgi:SPP1 gp7 family putative phage head morphogenesis protein